MSDFAEDKVKVRFKFRSGDEFEAEGTPEFIEKQRSDFLQLINQDRSPARQRRGTTPVAFAPSTTQNESSPSNADTSSPEPIETSEPALYRRNPPHTSSPEPMSPFTSRITSTPQTTPISTLPAAPMITQGISAAERAALRPHVSSIRGETTSNTTSTVNILLWEEIVRVEDQMVFLRRKNRLLTPETAAIVLLAAARILLRLPDGYSALALSKSLKKSGYGGERLDRVLGGEMKLGIVLSVGSKRSRLYYLSNEGFAKAYVLAEKLIELR